MRHTCLCFVLASSVLFFDSLAANADQSRPVVCDAGCTPASAAREFRTDSFSGFFGKLLDTRDYPARWYCGTWTLETGWLHVLSDLAIFGAYFAIPIVLLYFLLRRRDLPFPRIIWLFATFILACGIGHLVDATLFWWPAYRFSALVKLLTAVISWVTVLMLIRLMPSILRLPSMALLAHELQKTNERLDCALAAGNIGVWEWHVDGDLFLADTRAAQLHGLTAESDRTLDAFLGRIHPDDQAAVRDAIARCRDSAIPYAVSYRVPLDGGQLRHVQAHGKVLSAPQAALQLVGVCTDVTAAQEAHAKIRKLSLVASKTRHSVIIADANGHSEWANEAFTELTGYTQAEVLGKKPGELLQGPRTDPQTIALIGNRLRERQTVSVELLNYSKSGREYWISLEIDPVFDDDGRLVNFIATQSDITLAKQREADLRLAIDEAQRANHTKSKFLANISHEIRTPLNGILGFADLLVRGGARISPEEHDEYLQTIHSSGRHLLALINDVLDLSKIEAGQLQVESIPCAPQEIIAETVSSFRAAAAGKSISLDFRCDAPFAASIRTDPHRLKQLLLNLIGNAVKFTDQGCVLVVAHINHHAPRPELVVEVRDTGVGIPQDKLEAVFQPFVQADDSVTRRFGGTGLGLSISRKIALALGGDLTVSSTVGRGSTFTARIVAEDAIVEVKPAIAAAPAPPAAAPPARKTFPQTQELAGLNVLVVDDGDTNRKLIRLLLERSGARVQQAENGQIAIDLAERTPFDLIFMDMQMPVMDGYTATRVLRERGFTAPIIALTAHAMKGSREQCELAGCSGYLSKPINPDQLFQALAEQAVGKKNPVATPDAGCTLTAARASAAVIDAAPIRSQLPTSDADFREIVVEFLDTLEGKLSQMAAAWDQGDCGELAQLAHWLKGAGGTVGFTCFTAPAADLEQVAKSGNLKAAESHLDSLRALQTRIVV